MKEMKLFRNRFILILFFVFPVIILGQGSFTFQDSLILNSAKNDTSLLRQISINQTGTRIAAKAQYQIATSLYKAKNEKAAKSEFLQLHKRYSSYPEAAQAAYYLGEYAFRKEKYQDAIMYLKEFLLSYPSVPHSEWSKYYILKSLYRLNDSAFIPAANSFLAENHQSVNKKHLSIRTDIVNFLCNNNQYNQALSQAESLINTYPNDSLSNLVSLKKGEILIKLKRNNDAIAHYKYLLGKMKTEGAADSLFAKVHYKLTLLHYDANEDKSAEQEFSLFNTRLSKSTEIANRSLYLGTIAYHQANYKDAVKYLTTFLKSKPSIKQSEWTKYYIIKSLYRMDDSSYAGEATSFLNETHQFVNIQHSVIQHDLVIYLRKHNLHTQALTEADKMINTYPADTLTNEFFFTKGEILTSLHRYDEAVLHFSSLIKSPGINDKLSARAQFMLGWVYENRKDIVNAKINYQFVLSKYPKNEKWCSASEFALAFLTNQEKPQKMLTIPVSTNRNHRYNPALLQRGQSSQNKQTEINGLNEFSNFIAKHPKDTHTPHALMVLANIEISRRNYSKAIEYYDRIANFDSSVFLNKPKAEFRSKDAKGYKKLLTETMTAKAGLLLDKMGKPADALSIYDTLLSKHPLDKTVKLNKAICHIKLGNNNEARNILVDLAKSNDTQKLIIQHYLKQLK